MTTVPLTDAKTRLNELVDDVASTQERITITRHGRPVAVVLSVDDLESMEETLFWLSQPGIHEAIATARQEQADGKLLSVAEVRASFGLT